MTDYQVDHLRDKEGRIQADRVANEAAAEHDVRAEERRMGREQRLYTFKLTQLIWLAFGVLEGLIGLRVLLRLMAANPDNPFAAFVYSITELFVLPFQGLTAQPSAEGFVLELSSIIAMLVYALLAWATAKLVWVLLYKPRETV